jgi:hypothetical protein
LVGGTGCPTTDNNVGGLGNDAAVGSDASADGAGGISSGGASGQGGEGNEAGPQGVGGSGGAQTAPTNGVDASAVGPLGPSQSWTGYVENYTFPSGSDVIKLSFSYDSNGHVVGQVILGNGTPPPPATDPNVGYPPGFTGPMYEPTEIEGFAYSLAGGTLAASRLRFTIEGTEPWAGWCALQTPPSDGSSGCLPNFSSAAMGGGGTQCSYTTSGGPTVVVDCGKWNLCEGPMATSLASVCLCAPTGCGARPGLFPTSFDMFLANGAASGSMVGSAVSPEQTPYNVHFLQDL